MADRRPPLWVRALATVIPRLPAGRYWAIHQLRHARTPPFMMRLPARLGGFLYECDLRDSVAREVCYTGGYEPQETAIASHLLRAGDVFVDVGANWGYFSLAAAHRVGPGGRVVAFEPEPRLYRMLSANIAANGIRIIAAHQCAVAAGPGEIAFAAFQPDEGNWGVSHAVASDVAADFTTPTVALDAALDAAGIDAVSLVKIDVEGGEADVLSGMRSGLASGRYRRVLLECHPALLAERGETAGGCIDRLRGAGYRVWIIAHSADAHRRAASGTTSLREMIGPYTEGAALGGWPHVLAVAPGGPDPV